MEKILKVLCQSTTSQVFSLLRTEGFEIRWRKGVIGRRAKRYAYRPGRTNTSPLVVCHADTVVNGGDGPHPYRIEGDRVTCIALDDRLGIACMLSATGLLGGCAMLVCDDEEIGRTSAHVFSEACEPNWMVELDRRGTDVVTYDYGSPLLHGLLQGVGFEIGNGSYSDISALEHLGVIGFNVGVGYNGEHTPDCYAVLSDTRAQLERLNEFLKKFAETKLVHSVEQYFEPRDSRIEYEFDRDPRWSDYTGEGYEWR